MPQRRRRVRRQPVWLHDWSAAEPFDDAAHAGLRAAIAAALDRNPT